MRSDSMNSPVHVKKRQPMASYSEMMHFVLSCKPIVTWYFIFGSVFAVMNGLVYPILAFLFSITFSKISAVQSQGLDQIRKIAFAFMGFGTYALLVGTFQSWFFELVAYHASNLFHLEWFKALLRQDQAFFDIYEVGGIASQVGPNAGKFRRGIGRKFGEGVQYLTTFVGGLVFALYSCWQVALVVLAVLPFVATSAYVVVTLNQSKGVRASKSYRNAGKVAYSTVSSIKTVLSLNALEQMILQYSCATREAYDETIGTLAKQGLANGAMQASFLALYCILAIFGSYLLYRSIRDNGCDPRGSVDGNEACDPSATRVFSALLGVAIAARGVSQCGSIFEGIAAARVAVYEALEAINRKPGSPERVFYKSEVGNIGLIPNNDEKDREGAVATEVPLVRAVLPKYEIDSTSTEGLKPSTVRGAISIKDIHFAYPTRPGDPVLQGYSVEIEAGQTVAFVGPSGGGKSTVVSLLERFYDPQLGSIEIDAINIKDFNVKHLRSLIGYVGQEPTLFDTSIRNNISYGNPKATAEQIEEAARLANAHDFIVSFSDGYETQVGDKGSQLSGGQKQRIAIARVLVGNPRILLLDEATSALDAESELVVQKALDTILQERHITTIIIAHRLSTIRNADRINVIIGGRVAESGSHDELMATQSYYKGLVEKQEGKADAEGATLSGGSVHGSVLESPAVQVEVSDVVPHVAFKNVRFAYPTRPRKIILDDFNLVVMTGQTVALVGPSGGGKSTTVGLIERFYDPIEGAVEFMGVDVRSLNVGWYRDQIGYVGQEPTLFNDTIGRNIAYGTPSATQEEILEAARQANAHDFIMSFPDGFETVVGERGAQLSGGQKQRIAIARALVKRPSLLLLDEATSALDNESEAIVQEAIDRLMERTESTVVLIAHRLSTIRKADMIAVVANGRVVEIGSHDELVANPHGLYKRLFESSKRDSTMDSVRFAGESTVNKRIETDEEEEIDWENKVKEEESAPFSAKRAREMAKPDVPFLLVGALGAVFAGAVFPVWGLLLSETINLLFRPVQLCPQPDGTIPLYFENCDEYWHEVSRGMQVDSFKVSGYWAAAMAGCLIGNVLMFWGFGVATERLNKRIRDASFQALVRQEVAYFDKRSVGRITSQLQDDAARIHAFSGEPIRALIEAVSAVLTGVVLSFIFMWQLALVALACIPIMGFAMSLHMKKLLGQDESDSGNTTGRRNTPGGILVESLLNIRTVAALTLEERCFEDYVSALLNSNMNFAVEAFANGVVSGLSLFIQQWVNALQIWFGGHLLVHFPHYNFKDFLIAMFSLLFGLFGLGAAFQDISDRKEVDKSASRIFYLLDRQSAIDPLSMAGKKLK